MLGTPYFSYAFIKWRQFKRPVEKYIFPVNNYFSGTKNLKESILFPVEKVKLPVNNFSSRIIFF